MQTITVEALKAKLDAGEKINLVDVREPHEQSAGALTQYLTQPYAVLEMPLSKLADALMAQRLRPEQPLLLVCRSGNRSLVACKVLGRLGFKQVFNLKGGTALLC